MERFGLLAGLASLAVGLLATSAAAQIEQPAAVATFAAGDSAVVAGMELFEDIIYLPVRVNDAGPFPFVLDTGAGPYSGLDQDAVATLGIPSTPLGQGGGAGQDQVAIHRVDGVAVSLAGLAFAPRTLVGLPLHRMDPHWGKRKDGILGGDLLSTLVTVVDYGRGRLVFHDPAAYGDQAPGERLPVDVVQGFLFVRAQVLRYGTDDPLEAYFMLDTGVRTSLFNAPFAAEHQLAAQSPATLEGVTGFGLGGVSRGVVGRVRAIRLGDISVENPVVTFSTDTTGALASQGFSGIIGADILSRFTVVLDYGRSYVALARNGRFGAPFEYDMCGIRFLMKGERFDTFVVFSVFPGSPAAEAGIAEGDVVTAIDGRPAREFDRQSLGAYLRRDGAVVRFTLERGDDVRDVSLTLRRLV